MIKGVKDVVGQGAYSYCVVLKEHGQVLVAMWARCYGEYMK